MISSLFSLTKSRLSCFGLDDKKNDTLKEVPLPSKLNLVVKDEEVRNDDLIVKVGTQVKTGQRLALTANGDSHIISTATGTISSLSKVPERFGRTFPMISIETGGEDEWDDEFSKLVQASPPEEALKFLDALPGNGRFASLRNGSRPFDILMVTGVDQDLFVATNQLVLRTESELLKEGINHLKKMIPGVKVMIVVPVELSPQAEETGAEVKAIHPAYPDVLPKLIVKNVIGRSVPAGMECQDMGVRFISAESVAALGVAFSEGRLPVQKRLTVIGKDLSCINVRARIGTPVKEILQAVKIETAHGDRLVLGGPMSGQAVHSEEAPVLHDTDAIFVQDKDDIAEISNSPCVNCGECVRACPARIPVNMLVRVLENSLWSEAARSYDLLSCIECGLCSYVCIARIPVFQYIMLGKYEFERMKAAEELNE